MKPWVKWCINNNVKFLVYIVWLIALPAFLLAYTENAVQDAIVELNWIKNIKKGDL
jgi:hypothetical protein